MSEFGQVRRITEMYMAGVRGRRYGFTGVREVSLARLFTIKLPSLLFAKFHCHNSSRKEFL